MKNSLLTLCMLIGFLSYGQVPTTNLAGEYKFTNGTLTDAIGSNDLTQTGSALTLVDNRANGASKAIDLNGDYLQRAAFTNIQHLSISYWIKTITNDATVKTIIDHSSRTTDANTQSQYGWYTFLQNGKVGVAGNFHYSYTSGGIQQGESGYASAISTTNVADGTWHHVAISLHKRIYYWQNSQWIFENTYAVYVDGIREGIVLPFKKTGTGSMLSSNMFPGNSVTIGNISNGNSVTHYSEIIDDIRFYENHVFTPAEVTSLYNEVSCSDGTGITAIAQDITRQLDATGNIVISAEEIDNGSNADCDAAFSLSIDKTSFSCADIGANTVTLTATELTGSQSSTTATVTILPSVITQDITVQIDASGNATITASDVDNGSAAICSASPTYSLDITAFTCSDLGANIVTLTIDYGNGNIGTGTATVTVEDTLVPTAIGQNINLQVDGVATITPAMIDNSSIDNCGGALTFLLSKTIFRCEDTGDNTVTFTVEDASGNVATTDVTVTVTSAVVDETVTATNTNICLDGSTGSTISTGSSVVGFNYSLRNSETNSIVDGPYGGTGNALDFVTGNLSETTTFYVYSEKPSSSTNTALDFDGTDDFVEATVNAAFDYENGYTIETWVKVAVPVGGNYPVFSVGSSSISDIEVYVQSGTNRLVVAHDRGEAATFGGYSYSIPPNNQWFHLAITYDGVSAIKVYFDGIEQSVTDVSFAPAGALTKTAGLTMKIGKIANTAFGAYGGRFVGQLDEVRVWKIARTEIELLANKDVCLDGTETDLEYYFRLDDSTGTTATDLVNGTNGTLTNMDAITDWIASGTNMICAEYASCDFQMTTEVTIGDNTDPTANAQNISVQIDAGTGVATITPAMIDDGSSDNCAAGLTLSLSQTEFGCDDIGTNTVTLTVEDAAGNQSTIDATVTVTSSINDETITASAANFCSGSSYVDITTGSSVDGIDYYLRNNSNDSIIDGPITGTDSGLTFNSGNLTETTTFNVYGEFTAPGPHSALDFDGVNDKVVTAFVPPAGNNLTVELWVYPRDASFSRILSSYQGNSTVLAGEIVLDTYDPTFNNGRGLRFYISGAGHVSHFLTVPNVLTLNSWNHVAATFHSGVIKLFVDGILVGTSATGPFTSRPQSSATITIGEDRIEGGAAEYFNGQMDEIRIWDTAKSESEILASKNSCLTGSEYGLQLYYNFDENTGLATNDLAGSNNGTLTNMDGATDWISSGVNMSCGMSCGFQMSDTVTVVMNPTYNLVDAVSVCSGESYTFPDGTTIDNIISQVIDTSNLQTVSTSCDSIIITTVDVNPSYSLSETISICSGESYTFPDGTTQNNIINQVIYTSNLQTANILCDSIIETTVIVNPFYNLTETVEICSGESYTFPDGTLQSNITAQVIYTSDLQTLGSACDSIITTTVNIGSEYNLSKAISICSGESYTFPDGTTQNEITAEVIYTSNLQTINGGCDSVIVTTVSINPTYHFTDTVAICSGDSYTFHDGTTENNITSQLVYTSNLQTVATGCDSIIVTTINIGEVYNIAESYMLCSGENYTFPDGTSQTNIISQVIYTSNLQTVVTGCDSIIVTTINIGQAYNLSESVTICSGESYTFPDGTTETNITAQLIYTSNLQTVEAACDSIIVTTINTGQTYNQAESVAVCYGESYTFPDGTTQTNITVQLIYTSNLQTVEIGCDSIIEITVNVNSIDVSVSQNGNVLTANVNGADYQWLDCNNGNAPIASEINQSFSATSNGNYAVAITVGTCSNTSDCISISTLEVEQDFHQSISIYPNPVSSVLTIESELLTIEEVHIIDFSGKTIRVIIPSSNKINIADLSKGVYIIRFKTNDKIIYNRFVKE